MTPGKVCELSARCEEVIDQLVDEIWRLCEALRTIKDRALNEEISMDLYWVAHYALESDE